MRNPRRPEARAQGEHMAQRRLPCRRRGEQRSCRSEVAKASRVGGQKGQHLRAFDVCVIDVHRLCTSFFPSLLTLVVPSMTANKSLLQI